jgi:hypothetical protein
MINPGGKTPYYCTVCSQCLIFLSNMLLLVLFRSSTLYGLLTLSSDCCARNAQPDPH